jgi:hypothetical protein
VGHRIQQSETFIPAVNQLLYRLFLCIGMIARHGIRMVTRELAEEECIYRCMYQGVSCTSVDPGARSGTYELLKGKCSKILSLCYLLHDVNMVSVQ